MSARPSNELQWLDLKMGDTGIVVLGPGLQTDFRIKIHVS